MDSYTKGELKVIYAGRQSGKSWFTQQYMTHPFNWALTKFERVNSEKDDDVLCDVNQDIQDWLMREFEPGVLWKYATKFVTEKFPKVAYGCERVLMKQDVYTALVLKWS